MPPNIRYISYHFENSFHRAKLKNSINAERLKISTQRLSIVPLLKFFKVDVSNRNILIKMRFRVPDIRFQVNISSRKLLCLQCCSGLYFNNKQIVNSGIFYGTHNQIMCQKMFLYIF